MPSLWTRSESRLFRCHDVLILLGLPRRYGWRSWEILAVVEYLFAALVAGLPACIAYLGGGGHRFRSIVGTINLALAFLVAIGTAAQLMNDPPARSAMASGFLSIILAVTAVAVRLSPDPSPAGNRRAPQGTAQTAQQTHPGQWTAPHHPGVPAAPGLGGAPGEVSPQPQPHQQQPWQPPGQQR